MGRHHVRNYASFSQVDQVLVVEPSSDSKRKLQEMNLDEVVLFDDLETALKQKPDAASVVVPTPYHAQTAGMILERKIPCLVEKPLAASILEGKALQALAEKHEVPLMVGHIERFNPGVQALKKRIHDIGSIVYASAHRFGIPGQRKLGNAFFDQGVHDLDVISYLSGKYPKNALAVQQTFLEENDLGAALVDYDGFYASVEVNRVVPVKKRELVVLGTKGCATLDYISQELTITLSDQAVKESKSFDEILWRVGRGTEVRPYFAKDEPLKLELEHFLECAKKGEKPLCTAQDGLAAIAVAEACVRSAESGTKEKVDI